MPRLLTSLLLAFLLLAGPALCVGGLLPHACDCGHDGAETQCEHEDACADDPCATYTVSPRDARSLLDVDFPWIAPVDVVRDAQLAATRRSRSIEPPLRPDRWNLPYRASDRPLLI